MLSGGMHCCHSDQCNPVVPNSTDTHCVMHLYTPEQVPRSPVPTDIGVQSNFFTPNPRKVFHSKHVHLVPPQILHVLQLANNFQEYSTAGRQQHQQQEDTAPCCSSSSSSSSSTAAGSSSDAAAVAAAGDAAAFAAEAAEGRAIRFCESMPNKMIAQTAYLLFTIKQLHQERDAPATFFSQTFASLGLQQLTPVCLQQQQQEEVGKPSGDQRKGQRYQAVQTWLSQRAASQLEHRKTQHSCSSSSSTAAASAAVQDSLRDQIDWPSQLLMVIGTGESAGEAADEMIGGVCEWQMQWVQTAAQLRLATARLEAAERLRIEQQVVEKDRRAAAEAPTGKAGAQFDGSSCGEGANQGVSRSSSSKGGLAGEGDKQQPVECLICAAEAAAAQLLCSSSSSSSSRQAGTAAGGKGLYSNLPVSWSDPCLMRRLLWELLGKLKPAAQQWFKQHARMCPHRGNIVLWHMVVMSLARHIWAPLGDWNLHSQQQMRLVLAPSAIDRTLTLRAEAQPGRTVHYARALGFAFERDADAFGAAVLSLQVLLALDPHGARVQPRPELLFYTPAGFHSAVCKTIVQATVLPAPPPAPEPAAGEAGDDVAAAAAAGDADDVDSMEGGSCEVRPPHYLQAWSDALLPAWYVWWHIGLLAYHQQQQQQQQQQHTAAVVSPPLSPDTPQPLVLPGRQAPLAAAAADGVVRGAVAAATQKAQPGRSSSSTSSGGGSSAQAPVCLQDLYSSPDARCVPSASFWGWVRGWLSGNFQAVTRH